MIYNKYREPFRFWCQKVIPLVYDDSLSYYELLCKVVDYLNHTMEDVGTIGTELTELKTYIDEKLEEYLVDEDLEQLVNDKVVEMFDSGELDEFQKETFITPMFKNLKYFVDEELTGSNLDTAVNNALTQGYDKLYIPSGTYIIPYLNINRNVEIACEGGVNIVVNDNVEHGLIRVQNCTFKWHGGNFRISDETESIVLMNNGGFGTPVFHLYGCRNSEITDVVCSENKLPKFAFIDNCVHTRVYNCTLRNLLGAGVFICDTCQDITIEDCTITNIRKCVDRITGTTYDYCYAVYTGVSSATTAIEPCNNLVYRNNYINHSEDCALDTHGASNVIIENNVILDTVNAITAYNDNSRDLRPTGWTMENIYIRNNYCSSTRDIPETATYPHPFVLIGASNVYSEIYENPYIQGNYGGLYNYMNCIIENNYFNTRNTGGSGGGSSPATFGKEIISGSSGCNIHVVNNTFVCHDNIPFKPILFFNFLFEDNIAFTPRTRTASGIGCTGKSVNNIDFDVIANELSLSVIESDYLNETTALKKAGAILESFYQNYVLYSGFKIGRSPNQVSGSILYDANTNLGVRISQNVCTITNYPETVNTMALFAKWFIPTGTPLVLSRNGVSDENIYVGKYLSPNSFLMVNARGGSYTPSSPNVSLGIVKFRSLTRTILFSPS